MAKIKAVSSVAASVNVDAPVATTCNVWTLPLEIFTVNFAKTAKNDKPKVILELAVPRQGIGTIQVFAPSYLSYDEQFAYLAEYFEHGMTINGADNQPEVSEDGIVDGFYFKRYDIDGPNYELISAKSAASKLEATGLNSSVMTFGTANTKLTRAQVETSTALQRGNYTKVIASDEKRLNNYIGTIAQGIGGLFK